MGGSIKDCINEILNFVLMGALISKARSGPGFALIGIRFKSRFDHRLAGFCHLPFKCLRQLSSFGKCFFPLRGRKAY